MANYITLLGAEDIRRAGNAMQAAAEEMMRGTGYQQEALQQHQRFMDDWLSRFETAIERLVPKEPGNGKSEDVA